MGVTLNAMDRFENAILRRVERLGNLVAVFVPRMGRVRVSLGAIETVGGLASATLFRLGQCFADRSEKKAYKAMVDRSLSYVKNGLGNMVRGGIEMVPLGGALTVIFYDAFAKKRMRYTGEQKAKALKANGQQPHTSAASGHAPAASAVSGQAPPPPYYQPPSAPPTHYQQQQQQHQSNPMPGYFPQQAIAPPSLYPSINGDVVYQHPQVYPSQQPYQYDPHGAPPYSNITYLPQQQPQQDRL